MSDVGHSRHETRYVMTVIVVYGGTPLRTLTNAHLAQRRKGNWTSDGTAEASPTHWPS